MSRNSVMQRGTSIAFYIDSLKLGGAERVLLQWADWCKQAGWFVVVLTRQSVDADAYPFPLGIERMVEPPDSRWLLALGWWGFPFRIFRLRRIFKRRHFHVVVGVTTLPAVKILLANWGGDSVCVACERNYPPAKPPSLIWRFLRRITYPWADLHIVQTRLAGEWLSRNCHSKRQLLLPNPIVWPLPCHSPRVDPHDWVPDKAPVLLAAGTKAHQKGFDLIVEVFRLLAKRRPDLRLVLLGLHSTIYHGENQQVAMRRHLGDSELQARLLMPGPVGNMADWYERATLFVLPSRYEGFPNVLLEAMAAGCACIASDCPTGPAEIIRPGIDGVLLPLGAGREVWASCLEGLLANPEERQRLGISATSVRQRFNASELQHRLLKTLADLNANG